MMSRGMSAGEEYHALARLLIAQGKTGEVLVILDKLYRRDKSVGRAGRVLDILVWKVRALADIGDTPRATTALLEALAIGEPGNYLRTFLEPGQPIEKLLSDLPVSAYRDRLLAAFGKEEPQRPKDISQDASLPETLIDREFAILHLMAAGMSNREIRDEIIPLRKYHSLVRQADLYEIGGFGSWRRCSAGTSTRLDLT